jgi:hypothetical protein
VDRRPGHRRVRLVLAAGDPACPTGGSCGSGTSSATISPCWTWSSTPTPNASWASEPWRRWRTCGRSRCRCRAPPST